MSEKIRPEHLERGAYVYVRPHSRSSIIGRDNSGSTTWLSEPSSWGSRAW